MSDRFSPGHRGPGSHGDPDPGGLLPEAVAEAILDGQPLDGRVLREPLAAEVWPLMETMGALRAAPTAAEFRGQAAAMAAFREVSGIAGPEELAHTLQLEVPHLGAGRRAARARHRAPARRRPAGRPSAKRRLGLAAAGAAALVAILGIFSYSGYLPGPFQGDSRMATSSPGAQRSSPAPASRSATGPGGLAGSSATPAPAPTPTPAPTPAAGSQSQAARLCQAYFADPWRDLNDFMKLSKAAGGPMKVYNYCRPYLQDEPGHVPDNNDAPPPGFGHGNGGNGSSQDGSGSTTSPQQAR